MDVAMDADMIVMNATIAGTDATGQEGCMCATVMIAIALNA